MSEAFTRTTLIGTSAETGETFVTIEWDGRRLSISGVEGPKPNGNCRGSCGQIEASIESFAEGWDQEKLDKLRTLWRRWHLNDMRAGCEHQRAEGWADRPIDPSKPTDAYIKHPDGSRGWNRLTWLPAKDGGLLCAPCPTCGYKYGTAWLYEAVPQDVIDWLGALPDSGTDDWGRPNGRVA